MQIQICHSKEQVFSLATTEKLQLRRNVMCILSDMLDRALEQVVRFSLFLENKIMQLRYLIEERNWVGEKSICWVGIIKDGFASFGNGKMGRDTAFAQMSRNWFSSLLT